MARKSTKGGSRGSRSNGTGKGEGSGTPVRKRVARFSPEVRQQALELILRGVPRREIAGKIGCSMESLRLWARAAEKELSGEPQAPAPTAPKDPGAGLGEAEVQAILELKKKHPTMGPAQLRAQINFGSRNPAWHLLTLRPRGQAPRL